MGLCSIVSYWIGIYKLILLSFPLAPSQRFEICYTFRNNKQTVFAEIVLFSTTLLGFRLVVAVWTLIRWYYGRIVFRSQFETFPILLCVVNTLHSLQELPGVTWSYLLWPRPHVYRHAVQSRSSGPAPSSREGKEQH